MPARRTRKKKATPRTVQIPFDCAEAIAERAAIALEIRKGWVKAPSAEKKYQYKSPYIRVVKVGT